MTNDGPLSINFFVTLPDLHQEQLTDEERPMTAHERAHARLDVAVINKQNDDTSDLIPDTETSLGPTSEEISDKLWVHENGYIHLEGHPELVLGVSQCKLNQKVRKYSLFVYLTSLGTVHKKR